MQSTRDVWLYYIWHTRIKCTCQLTFLFYFWECHVTLWNWNWPSNEIYQTYALMFFTVSLSRKNKTDQYGATTIKHLYKTRPQFLPNYHADILWPLSLHQIHPNISYKQFTVKNSTHSQCFVIKDTMWCCESLQLCHEF